MNYPNPNDNPARQALTRAVDRAIANGSPVVVNVAAEPAEPTTVVVYSPSTDEVYLQRELGDTEIMDARVFADQAADMFCAEIDDSDGYIPNCSGDIRVEFRPDANNPTYIWSGQSFYFKAE